MPREAKGSARRCALLIGMVAVFSVSAQARAADKALCASAYEEAQRQRSGGTLLVARAQLLTCQEHCPAALVADCNRWKEEVEALIPRVRVTAIGPDGRPTTAVRVTEAGVLIASNIEGLLELDPGAHDLTFEFADEDPVHKVIKLSPGRKVVTVQISFATEGVPREPANASPARPPPKSEIPPASVVLGVVGLAGLAAGGVLGLVGHQKRAELADTCKPNCTEEDVSPIRTLWVVGGVSAAIGAVALGGALVIWQSEGSHEVAVSAAPTPKAPQLFVSARF